MTQIDTLFRFVLLCVLTGLALAMAQAPCNQVADPDNIAYKIAYQTALERAREPTHLKVHNDLKPITPENEDLIWNEKGEVLMVTLTRAAYFKNIQPGQVTSTTDYYWFSAVPYLKNFCSAYSGDNLNLRVLQVLGLPPDKCDTRLAEFWVHPKSLFRPCPDPEIYDTQCVVSVPMMAQDPAHGRDQPPWYCPGATPSRQEGVAFEHISDTHLNWMCAWWKGSYTHTELYQNYPWTALGYTYDWGDLDDPRGMSEYVAPPNQSLTFHAIYTLEEYCGRH